MSKILMDPPAVPLITLEEAKTHERIDLDDADNDLLIANQIEAATRLAEEFTRRAFITQTWEFRTSRITPIIEIPRPRLQAIENDGILVFTNWNDQQTVIQPDTYFLDTIAEPGRLIFKQGILPVIPFNAGWGWYPDLPPGYLTFTFRAGYGDDPEDVPWQIKEAVLQIFGFLYENREGQPMAYGSIAHELLFPFQVEYI